MTGWVGPQIVSRSYMTGWDFFFDIHKSSTPDKSPGYITKMALLHKLYPDAKFVHIIRDGRDVWLSLKKLGWETNVVKVGRIWA